MQTRKRPSREWPLEGSSPGRRHASGLAVRPCGRLARSNDSRRLAGGPHVGPGASGENPTQLKARSKRMFLTAAVNWQSFYFWLFGLMACGFAFGVLVSSNIVRMAFYLVASLAATAVLFLLAGAKFVGAMQIMIYVGGTLVLLVFGVMLTAQATFISMKTSAAEWVMAAVVGGALLYLLVFSAW